MNKFNEEYIRKILLRHFTENQIRTVPGSVIDYEYDENGINISFTCYPFSGYIEVNKNYFKFYVERGTSIILCVVYPIERIEEVYFEMYSDFLEKIFLFQKETTRMTNLFTVGILPVDVVREYKLRAILED